MAVANGERLRKPALERTHPIRDLGGYLRAPEQNKAKTSGARMDTSLGGTFSSPEDVVVYGVKVGYKVVEEQIRKGQNMARRLRNASIKSGVGDSGDVIDYGMRFYKQLGVLFVETAETLMRSPNVLSYLLSKYRGESAPAAAGAAPGDSTASLVQAAKAVWPELAPVLKAALENYRTSLSTRGPKGSSGPAQSSPHAVEIASRRRSQVKLELWKDSSQAPPKVRGLLSDAKPPDILTSIEFVGNKDAEPAVRIKVDDKQPAGRYLGMVLDAGTEEPIGTLVVTIFDD